MPKITLTFSETGHGVDYDEGLDVHSDKSLNSLQWALFAAREDVERVISCRVDNRVKAIETLRKGVKE